MVRRTRSPSARQAETLQFVKAFGRTRTASPTLREIAEALGVKNGVSAHDCITALVRKGYLEKIKPAGGTRQLRVVGEPEVPVIDATGRIDPSEPLVDDSRIVETMRGVLAESFDPVPDFAVVREGECCLAELMVVCRRVDAKEGTTVLGRLGDEIVVGRIKGGRVELESGGVEAKRSRRRIRRTDPNFRLEGVVVGTVTARAVPQGD